MTYFHHLYRIFIMKGLINLFLEQYDQHLRFWSSQIDPYTNQVISLKPVFNHQLKVSYPCLSMMEYLTIKERIFRNNITSESFQFDHQSITNPFVTNDQTLHFLPFNSNQFKPYLLCSSHHQLFHQCQLCSSSSKQFQVVFNQTVFQSQKDFAEYQEYLDHQIQQILMQIMNQIQIKNSHSIQNITIQNLIRGLIKYWGSWIMHDPNCFLIDQFQWPVLIDTLKQNQFLQTWFWKINSLHQEIEWLKQSPFSTTSQYQLIQKQFLLNQWKSQQDYLVLIGLFQKGIDDLIPQLKKITFI